MAVNVLVIIVAPFWEDFFWGAAVPKMGRVRSGVWAFLVFNRYCPIAPQRDCTRQPYHPVYELHSFIHSFKGLAIAQTCRGHTVGTWSPSATPRTFTILAPSSRALDSFSCLIVFGMDRVPVYNVSEENLFFCFFWEGIHTKSTLLRSTM